MFLILLISLIVILVYLFYPIWLMVRPAYIPQSPDHPGRNPAVSLILLTYNGKAYIRDKITLLHQELNSFPAYEFIVIDDNSTDGTQELLESLQGSFGLKLVLKDVQRGIPHSMNLGARMAQHDILIFCDQRQAFTGDTLTGLTAPLQDAGTGAVSGFISCVDNTNGFSFLRKHENFIKKGESRTGCLIGVYGPLYAIRRECYSEIPENVILDDLYLSLKILAQKKIVLAECSRIVDEDFMTHYNFGRSNRYLRGLLQILVKRDLVGNLPFRMRIMLLWHKYLRLSIPPLIVLCCLAAGWRSFTDTRVAVIFLAGLLLFLASFLAHRVTLFSNLNSFLRINIYYVTSMVYLAVQELYEWAVMTMTTKKA